MPPADLSAWERVGPLLAARRAQISPRYANRRAFAADTGINWRTLFDAEHAKRANFKTETLSAFESAYELVPGSLARTLAGGDLEPAPDGPRLSPVPDPAPPLDLATADDALIEAMIAAWPEKTAEDMVMKRGLRGVWNLYTVAHGDRDTVVDALMAVLHRGPPLPEAGERPDQNRATS